MAVMNIQRFKIRRWKSAQFIRIKRNPHFFPCAGIYSDCNQYCHFNWICNLLRFFLSLSHCCCFCMCVCCICWSSFYIISKIESLTFLGAKPKLIYANLHLNTFVLLICRNVLFNVHLHFDMRSVRFPSIPYYACGAIERTIFRASFFLAFSVSLIHHLIDFSIC